jgi:NADPH-dependent 2,4-dienoyl-CoA reductase/sulfur reductase-like enzyme
MAKLLVIGGSDAGISAALRARELNPDTQVTVVVADSFPNFSICGLPFYISGEVPDWHRLAHRTVDEIQEAGVQLRLNHVARRITPDRKTVWVADETDALQELPYDRLVIATGALPVRPPLEGVDLPGVYLLHSMEDSFRVHEHVVSRQPRSAMIIGSGYIGLEMADALTHLGISVTLLVRSDSVFRTAVDPSLSRVVEDELSRHGVEVVKGVTPQSIARAGDGLVVAGSRDFERSTDLVLLAVGVRPAAELAKTAGIATGADGAICVGRDMSTNVPDIYAAGDCVETWHRVTERYTYLPLGTTAHKQGRIAGENAAGGQRRFAGSLGTQVVKVFDLAIARTGLRQHEAEREGFDPLTSETQVWDHKVYYPGAHELLIRVTGDRRSGRLLGAQIVGHWRSEVAKRIDIFATALFHRMRVEDLNDLDLSYTPPLSSPWDPVQMSAQAWVKAVQAEERT